MGRPKGKEDMAVMFEEILTDISENGFSLVTACKNRMSRESFYKYIKDNTERVDSYARACEDRADLIAEEILAIADNYEHDAITTEEGTVIDHAVVNRDRLRVDARKWILAKMHPKKYGDKIDMTSGNKPLAPALNITVKGDEAKDALQKISEDN